jgi:hypothetical protein
MNQPIGRAHRVDNRAAHHAIQMMQQSNRANQALILRNQRTMRYFMVPQPPEQATETEHPGPQTGRQTMTSLGLELARSFVINEYKPIDGSTPFEVVIDGKQISFGLGDHREYGLLQALIDIAEQESDD